jgi:hypothetical protein
VERTEEDLAEVAGEGNDVAKGMSQGASMNMEIVVLTSSSSGYY